MRFQQILRRLAMIDESCVEDQAGLALGPWGMSGCSSCQRLALAQLLSSKYQRPTRKGRSFPC
jgi:hypothetical protein